MRTSEIVFDEPMKETRMAAEPESRKINFGDASQDIGFALQTLTRWCDGGYSDAVSETVDLEAARKAIERVSRSEFDGGI